VETLTDRVDALFAEWDNPGSPGCALGIIREGQLVYARGYGMGNLDYNVPLTPNSVFYIASTSKQFTAASIVLLAQRGILSLEDDIRKYLPEIPRYDHPIAIRHLVHHTSGLRDYLTLMDLAGKSHEDYFDLADAIESLARQKGLNFPPGEQYLYCNSGYVLLAEIVKRASGQSLREFAQEAIFGPLGMTATHFDDDHKTVVKNRVVSYGCRKGGGFQRYLKSFDAVGSGGLLTTINDLFLWDRNFYDQRLGGSNFISHMLTRGRLNNGRALNYAFGLEHGEYRGLKTVAHPGSMLGFRTQMLRFPKQRFSVICLANLDTINPGRLAHQVADIYLADTFAVDSSVVEELHKLSDGELRAFTGVYQSLTSGMIVELFMHEGRLTADVLGLNLPLAPVSDTSFRALDAPTELEIAFARQGQDRALRARVIIEGQEPDTFQAIEVVSPTPDQLVDYVGDYYSDELQVSYKLVLEDDGLHCIYRNAPRNPLRPGSRDVFRLPQATLSFARDERDVVLGFILSADGARNLEFEKMIPAKAKRLQALARMFKGIKILISTSFSPAHIKAAALQE
jgi:CubicO group peptidase (beta-lactamase class C family)